VPYLKKQTGTLDLTRSLLSEKKQLRVIKSKEAIAYQKASYPQLVRCRRKWKVEEPIREHVAIHLRIFYRTDVQKGNSQDLNGELFYNTLQNKSGCAGIVSDDRQFVEKHEYRQYDKKEARVEFAITLPSTRFG